MFTPTAGVWAQRSRQRSPAALQSLRGLGSYEAWESSHPQTPVTIHSTDPIVRSYDTFFTPEEGAEVKRLAEPDMSRAVVSTTSGGAKADGRTNDVTWLPHDKSEGVWSLANRIADAVGLALDHAEPLQVVHYAVGQEYKKHWDA